MAAGDDSNSDNNNNDNNSNYNVSRTFCEYVAQIIFAPSKVKQWATPIFVTNNNNNNKGEDLYTRRDDGPLEHTFSMTGLTNAVRDTPGIVNDEHATLVVAKLIEYRLASATIDDDDYDEQARQAQAQAQQSFSRSYEQRRRDDDSDDDDVRDESEKEARQRRLRTSFTNAMLDAEVVHLVTGTGKMLSGGPSQLVAGETPSSIVLDMPVDLVDLQSLDFWTEHIYEKQAEKGVHFGIRTVVHPLLIGSVERKFSFPFFPLLNKKEKLAL